MAASGCWLQWKTCMRQIAIGSAEGFEALQRDSLNDARLAELRVAGQGGGPSV